MKRSKQGALDELQALRSALLQEIKDDAARNLLTDDLVSTILDLAWLHQFDDDRSTFKIEVQRLVSDAVEQHFLKERRA
jgi:hypothetical protein